MAETTNTTNTNNADAKPRRARRTSERVTETVRKTRDTVKASADDAARATVDALGANPLGVLAGAIAAGAVAAALIPATRRELETLGPWTESMKEALVEAFDAAKQAGTGELTAAGLTLAAASEGAGGIVGKIVKAAAAATTAAATSVKTSRSRDGTLAKAPGETSEQMQPAPLDA